MSRNTIQKEIICNVTKNMSNHPSPDEVYQEVHYAYPSISRATVYRVLNRLAEKGELLKVDMPHTAARFDYRTDEHIHFYCTKCGRVFDADINDSEQMKQMHEKISSNILMQEKGFEISQVNVSLEGICPYCR